METVSFQALRFGYLFLQTAETTKEPLLIERIVQALKQHEQICSAGEFLHLLVNLINMLAKDHKEFYSLKGKILETLCVYGDGSVRLYANRRDGIVFLISKRFGLTAFHHQPEQLAKATGCHLVEAPFAWSGFKRQAMALDEALDPELLCSNIEKSWPLPLT